MRTIEAYESIDGTVFTDHKKAEAHDEDCIGQELDALLRVALTAPNNNVTHHDQYRICLHMLQNRDKIAPIIATLHKYLNEPED